MSKKTIITILLVIALAIALIVNSNKNEGDTEATDIEDSLDIKDSSVNDELSIAEEQSGYETEHTDRNVHEIAFVQQDYFYKDTVHIKIACDKPCEIYYTLMVLILIKPKLLSGSH